MSTDADAAAAAALQIHVEQVAKRFGREWILRDVNASFRSGQVYGIEGRNGSGKSTLIRLLSGQLSPSRGRIRFQLEGKLVAATARYPQVSWTGPYLELVEQLTVAEQLEFHFGLKPLLPELTVNDVLNRIELQRYRNRTLLECSSGMRQRVLLATALYAATPLLLLDEPTVTLDDTAAEWFAGELRRFAPGRLVIIASNDARDLALCDECLSL